MAEKSGPDEALWAEAQRKFNGGGRRRSVHKKEESGSASQFGMLESINKEAIRILVRGTRGEILTLTPENIGTHELELNIRGQDGFVSV